MAKKKTLAELKAEKKAADERYYEELKATMNQEFHSVWDSTIKPALHNLKKVMDEVTDRFEDFEDEFKGYLKDKKPHVEDVEVNWLDLIYGDTIATKDIHSGSKNEKKSSRSEKRSWSDETKIKRVSDLLCMSNLAHASLTKEHDDNDDIQGSFRRAAERR